ncbi:hypothetical protein NK718_14330, partial [Alsobacter sp. SYSU M60028]|nr:hypothetical protein [Alsobacter ponti]
MRVAIYARDSSDLQREASIEDQLGELAAIVAALAEASPKSKLPGAQGRPGSQLSVVAGTGFEPV